MAAPSKPHKSDIFEEMAGYAEDVSKMVQSLTRSQEAAIDEHLADQISRIVFSSNFIENAGAGRNITVKICKTIFKGEAVPDEIGESDPEYEALKGDLMRKRLPTNVQFVLRSRREIVQHAKATSYIINELYLHGKDLTEDIILETHRILTHKVDTEQDISWTSTVRVSHGSRLHGSTPVHGSFLVP